MEGFYNIIRGEWVFLSYHYRGIFISLFLLGVLYFYLSSYKKPWQETFISKSFLLRVFLLFLSVGFLWFINEYALSWVIKPPKDRFVILVTKFHPTTLDAEKQGDNFRNRIIAALKGKNIDVKTIDEGVGTTPEEEEFNCALKYGRWWGVRAHLVLYGDISFDDKKNLILTPRLARTSTGELSAWEINISDPDLIKMGKVADKEIGDYATFLYGLSQYQIGEYKVAINIFNSLTYPTFESYFYIGNCRYSIGEYAEAIKNYKEVIKLKPTLSYAYHNMGAAFKKMVRYEEAIEKFSKATQIDNKDAEAFNGWGATLERLGHRNETINMFDKAKNCYKQAVPVLEKAIQLKPSEPYYYFNLGLVLFRLERFKEAIDNFKRAEELGQKDESVYALWGGALFNLGRYKEADEKLIKGVSPSTKDADVYSVWGATLNELAKYSNAVEKSKKAIELNPNNGFAYFNWGVALLGLHKNKEAASKLEMAKKLEPNRSIDVNNLLELIKKHPSGHIKFNYAAIKPLKSKEL